MTAPELSSKYIPQPGLSFKHGRQLWQARYSPCGKSLIAAGYDAQLHRWDVTGDEPKPLEPITGHNGWVQTIAFAGERLISADSWGKLACWKYADASPAPLWQHEQAHPGWIRSVAVNADKSLVASCGNDTIVRIWSIGDGTLKHELGEHTAKVFSVCFDPDGTSLVTGDAKGIIRHWDLGRKKVVRQLDASALYRLDRIQECGGARHLAFNQGGDMLLCAGQKTPSGGFATGLPAVLIFAWNTGKQIHEMQLGGVDDGFVYDAQFHPAGFVMACASAFPGRGPFWFWQPGEPKPFYVGKGLTNGHSISLHPDGRRLALLIDESANGNGRQLKDGQYVGGAAKFQILNLA